jgi:hypothetical protein
MSTTITDAQVAKLARKVLKADTAAAAHAIVLLQVGGLSDAQVDVLRAVASFMIADIAQAPAADAEPARTRGTVKTNAGTALAARVRKLAEGGDRTRAAIRAKKLGEFDADLTVEFVESLSDEDCLKLVATPVFEGAVATERLA